MGAAKAKPTPTSGAWLALDDHGQPTKVVYTAPVSGIQIVAPDTEPTEASQVALELAIATYGTK